MTDARNWTDLYYSSHDGLRLHARHYAAAPAGRTRPARPLLCLSSLAGNAAEFHALASFLSSHADTPRDVYCPDYRGRGLSQHDRNADNYSPYVELRDILDFLAAFNLHQVDLIGSSRGGINLMLLATVRPAALGTLILNDLGPVLEPEGVARVVGYLANLSRPTDWAAARGVMRDMYAHHFPALTDADYDDLAHRWFVEKSAPASGSSSASPRSYSAAVAPHKTARLDFTYDPRVAHANRHLDLRRTLPDMWGQYLALLRRPLLIIRGEHSDLLSRKTLEHMRTVHWRARAVTVPGQGHAPLLRDQASLKTVHAFLAEND